MSCVVGLGEDEAYWGIIEIGAWEVVGLVVMVERVGILTMVFLSKMRS